MTSASTSKATASTSKAIDLTDADAEEGEEDLTDKWVNLSETSLRAKMYTMVQYDVNNVLKMSELILLLSVPLKLKSRNFLLVISRGI